MDRSNHAPCAIHFIYCCGALILRTMYYVEKWIEGRLYYKHTPDGEWKEFSLEAYAKRVMEREKEILSLRADLESEKAKSQMWHRKANGNERYLD